jgi:hypothetical protein
LRFPILQNVVPRVRGKRVKTAGKSPVSKKTIQINFGLRGEAARQRVSESASQQVSELAALKRVLAELAELASAPTLAVLLSEAWTCLALFCGSV